MAGDRLFETAGRTIENFLDSTIRRWIWIVLEKMSDFDTTIK
jgi:hypothetical protein